MKRRVDNKRRWREGEAGEQEIKKQMIWRKRRVGKEGKAIIGSLS